MVSKKGSVSKNLVFKKNLSHSLKKISVSVSKKVSVSVPMKILVSSLSEPKVRSAVLGKVRQEKIGDIPFPLQKILKSPSISDNILQGSRQKFKMGQNYFQVG